MSCLTCTIVILSLITSECFLNQIKSPRNYSFKLRLSNESPNLLKEQLGEFTNGLGSIFGQTKEQLSEIKTSLKSAVVDIKDVVPVINAKSSSTSSSNTQTSETESVASFIEQQDATIETAASVIPKIDGAKNEEPIIIKAEVDEPVIVKAKTEIPAVSKDITKKEESQVVKVAPPKIPLETYESVKSISAVKATPVENAVAVKSISIKETSKISPEVSEESIKKAQQAILKSFESINNKATTIATTTVTAPTPTPASVSAKKSDTAVVTGPPFFTELSPVLKKTEVEVAEEKSLGFFAGLKSLIKESEGATSETKTSPVAAVAEKKPTIAPTPSVVVTKNTVTSNPIPATPAAPQFGGMFDFLKSDPGAMAAAKTREGSTARAPPSISTAFSSAPKPTPIVSVPVSTPPVIEKKSVPVTEEKPVSSGGFFGWGASVPASAPVVIKATPVVTSKNEVVKPAFATKGVKIDIKETSAVVSTPKPVATVPPVVEKPASGGFFGWGASSSTAEPTPAVTPKINSVIVTPKVEVKVPVANDKPAVVEKPASSGGFFGWGASPASVDSKATSVMANKDESVKPAVATKGIKIETKIVSAPVTASKPATEQKKSSGGIFGWGASTPALAPVKVNPTVITPKTEVKAPVVVATKPTTPAAVEKPASSGGWFGWGSSSSTTAPVLAPAVIAKPAIIETIEKPASSGGWFGWGSSSSTTAPVVAPAVTAKPAIVETIEKPASSGGWFGWGSSSSSTTKSAQVVAAKVEVRAPIKPATTVTPAPDVEKPVSGGFLGWGISSSTPPSSTAFTPKTTTPVTSAAKVVTKPSVVPPAPVTPVTRAPVAPKQGMNATFQALVAKLLKNSQLKISDFQKSTNDFRVGSLTPKAYVTKLETLFGNENLSLIVNPLVQELPEKDLAAKLKTALNEVGLKKK